ncbi:MAG TPA: hypothetical protein VHW96_14610 [Solirubrobacteraceae bacterium]|jgi:hypothetical protein|nr:hypothetical protein [Solirubrobacteraceae bacterium]
MTSKLARGLASCATVTALALGSAAPALAHGDGHNCHDPNQNGQTGQSASVGSMPAQKTDLTGSTLDSASQAAIAAVPGATVTKATTDPNSRITDAAYKVHVTKSDGSHALVVEDSSFNVLAVESGHRFCHHKFGDHSHGDHVKHEGIRAHSR